MKAGWTTHQCHDFSCGDFQIELAKNNVVWPHLIVVGHVVELQMPIDVPAYFVSLSRINIGVGIPKGKDFLGTGSASCEASYEALEILIRIIHHIPKQLKRNELTNAHFSAIHQQPTKIQYEDPRTQV